MAHNDLISTLRIFCERTCTRSQDRRDDNQLQVYSFCSLPLTLVLSQIVDIAQYNCNYNDDTGNDRLRIGFYPQDIHCVCNNTHEQAAEERAGNSPAPTLEGNSADDSRRKRIQLIAGTCARADRIESRGKTIAATPQNNPLII